MTLHFAYGSNMSRALMRIRCPLAKEMGTATLDNHRFIITADGYASIAARRAAVVHGVLWRLTARDLAALNAYENIRSGLYRVWVLPVRAQERRMTALVYIARSRATGRAKPNYLDVILAAARDWQLPDAYVAELAGWETAAARARRAGGLGETA